MKSNSRTGHTDELRATYPFLHGAGKIAFQRWRADMTGIRMRHAEDINVGNMFDRRMWISGLKHLWLFVLPLAGKVGQLYILHSESFRDNMDHHHHHHKTLQGC